MADLVLTISIGSSSATRTLPSAKVANFRQFVMANKPIPQTFKDTHAGKTATEIELEWLAFWTTKYWRINVASGLFEYHKENADMGNFGKE